jgi:hypothetical protein
MNSQRLATAAETSLAGLASSASCEKHQVAIVIDVLYSQSLQALCPKRNWHRWRCCARTARSFIADN